MGHLKEKKTVRNKKRNKRITPQSNRGHKKMFKKMLNKHVKEK